MRRKLKQFTSSQTRRRLAFGIVSARRTTSRWRPLPNLLIIGAQRCGTSSLFKYLSGHPQCIPSIRKEVRFFTEYYDRGCGWYRSHFSLASRRSCDTTPVYFEATPDYLLDPRVARRAIELMPDVRIIVLLRDPVERAYSHYWHSRRLGVEPLSFEEAIRREPERIDPCLEKLEAGSNEAAGKDLLRYSYAERGRYGKQIERWISLIDDPSRILVLPSEELFKDTDGTFQRILRFLAVPEWRPTEYRNFSYSNERPVHPPMPPECREWLGAQLAPDMARFFEIIGPEAHTFEDWSYSSTWLSTHS